MRKEGDWQPIESAPSGVPIILAWTKPGNWQKYNEGLDWVWCAGELVDGEWQEGPYGQPDWWMKDPPPPPDMR